MDGTRYDLLRWKRWVRGLYMGGMEILHVVLEPGRGNRRRFVAQCRFEGEVFYRQYHVHLTHATFGTCCMGHSGTTAKDFAQVQKAKKQEKARKAQEKVSRRAALA